MHMTDNQNDVYAGFETFNRFPSVFYRKQSSSEWRLRLMSESRRRRTDPEDAEVRLRSTGVWEFRVHRKRRSGMIDKNRATSRRLSVGI